VGGGALAIASGYVAMAARKGGPLHRASGKVFFGAMLSMTGVAAVTAPLLPTDQWVNTPAAVFALYLTLSGWLVVRRPPRSAGRAEAALVVMPVGVAAVGFGLAVTSGGAGAYGAVYLFAVVSALAAARDLAMLRVGGLAGPARTARHLWRISGAFFVATGSYVFGQPAFQPDWLRGSLLATTLGLAPLALMAFWLLRVRAPRPWRPAAAR
jgi:hypothetical protein